MSTVPRNAPCPCGSGRKHKLCCGTTQSQERATRDALRALLSLANGFPLLRPESDDFEDWLTAHRGEAPTSELVEEGCGVLTTRERERITRSFADWYPPVWTNLVADIHNEDAAERAALVGSVTAALAEQPQPPQIVLELLEDVRELADPAEALSLSIAPADLWSIADAIAADWAVAALPEELGDEEYERAFRIVLKREARELLTKQHARRLALLVRRLARELPIDGYPRASQTLARACAACERDRRMRSRVAEMMLGDCLEYLEAEPFRIAA